MILLVDPEVWAHVAWRAFGLDRPETDTEWWAYEHFCACYGSFEECGAWLN